jgi:copper homeostasis protein
MDVDGLTPSPAAVRAARQAFSAPGVMAMIRPRSGEFVFSREEVNVMLRQIDEAADAGADGVVMGALHSDNHAVDEETLARLVTAAQRHGLITTFHRAFDATPDSATALETLIAHGVGRVLSSGTTWGSGQGAVQGLAALRRLVNQAAGRIEIVVGGGVTPVNAGEIIGALPRGAPIALHAYSSVLTCGAVTPDAVRALVEAA